jgi:hypothetical protein
MARPALVRIRARNPCVRDRRRLFGWNVRLLTENSRVVVSGRHSQDAGHPADQVPDLDDTSHHRTPASARRHATGAAVKHPHGTAVFPGGSNQRGRPAEPRDVVRCAAREHPHRVTTHRHREAPSSDVSHSPGQQAMVLSCWFRHRATRRARDGGRQSKKPGAAGGDYRSDTVVTSGHFDVGTANNTLVHSLWTTVWTGSDG